MTSPSAASLILAPNLNPSVKVLPYVLPAPANLGVLADNDDEMEDQITSKQKLELDDEELIILKMMGYFLEENELTNFVW